MAVLHAEDGASVVIEAIGEGAAVSVVNWAEVLSKLAEAGKDPEVAAAELRRAEVEGLGLLIQDPPFRLGSLSGTVPGDGRRKPYS